MKTLLAILSLIGLVASSLAQPTPAPTPPAPEPPKDWWTDFSLTPFGAVKHPDFGGPIWGGGLDLGYSINRAVSVHVVNSIFDYGCIDWFEHSSLDETEAYVRADLNDVLGLGNQRFVPFFLGGYTRDWEAQDHGFNVGLGVEFRFSKNFSVGADSRLRAFFHNDKDIITRGFLNLRF